MSLTDREVIAVAEKAAVEAVKTTLKMIGIDVDNPIDAQRDFTIMREVGKLVMDPEFRADIEHTRRWRKTMEAIPAKGLISVTAVIATGLAAIVWQAIIPHGK
jgi:hypothetical protein